MQTCRISLVMPTTERISEIVSMVVDSHCGEKVTDESVEMVKAEIIGIIKAESSIKFNPAS